MSARWQEWRSTTIPETRTAWVSGISRGSSYGSGLNSTATPVTTAQPSDSFELPHSPAQLCSDVLSFDYRLSPVEISALGLLVSDGDYLWSNLHEVIDLTGNIEIQKKIQSEVSSINSGSVHS